MLAIIVTALEFAVLPDSAASLTAPLFFLCGFFFLFLPPEREAPQPPSSLLSISTLSWQVLPNYAFRSDPSQMDVGQDLWVGASPQVFTQPSETPPSLGLRRLLLTPAFHLQAFPCSQPPAQAGASLWEGWAAPSAETPSSSPAVGMSWGCRWLEA